MIVSEKRIAANRANSLKSKGPTSVAGKCRSRENALKHGLTAIEVVPEDAETIQQAAETCFNFHRPRNRYQADLVDQVAILNIRAHRAQRIERKLRDQVALRAITSWDDDRNLEAERIGLELAIRPSAVVAELRRTPQGCDWILRRWAMLAGVAGAGWTPDQTRLAFDLIGTPVELRTGHPGATIDGDGATLDAGSDRPAVARAQIALNRLAREAVVGQDEIARALAEADLTDETNPEIRRIRRYEASLHRRLRWTVARLADPIPDHLPRLELRPDFFGAEARAAEEAAIAEAELQARIEKNDREWAEYHAKVRAQEAAEARAHEEAEKRKRKREEAKARKQAAIEAQNEATAQVQNEAIAEAQNEATSDPDDAPTPRQEARSRKTEARREAKRRKLGRRRA